MASKFDRSRHLERAAVEVGEGVGVGAGPVETAAGSALARRVTRPIAASGSRRDERVWFLYRTASSSPNSCSTRTRPTCGGAGTARIGDRRHRWTVSKISDKEDARREWTQAEDERSILEVVGAEQSAKSQTSESTHMTPAVGGTM